MEVNLKSQENILKLMQLLFLLALCLDSFDIFLVLDVFGFTVRLGLVLLVIPISYVFLRLIVNRKFYMPIGFIPLVIWTFFILLFIPNTNFLIRNIGYAGWLILYCCLIFTAVQIFNKKSDLKFLMTVYLVSFLFVSAFGVLQFSLGILGFEPPLVRQWWPNGIPRINGFSFEPSYYSTYLITGWVFSSYLFIKKVTLINKKIVMLTFIFSTIALILSSSRMGYIIMFAWMALYPVKLIFTNRKDWKSLLKYFGFAGVILAIILLVSILTLDFEDIKFLFEGLGILGMASHSSSTRLTFMGYTLQAFLNSPIIGYSLGGIPSAIGEMHNVVVNNQDLANIYEGMNVTSEILAGSGIFGFLFFVIFILIILAKPLFLSKRTLNSDEKAILKGIVFSFIFLFAILQFNQNILRLYFWMHLAIIAVVYQLVLADISGSKKNFVIDGRMWNHSGIGTYLKGVVPRFIKHFESVEFFIIIDDEANLPLDLVKLKNVRLIESNASIYSIKEQIFFIRKIYGRFDFFWSPHYNIPIFYDGKLYVTVHDVFHLAMPQYNNGIKKIYAKLLFTVLKYKAEKIFTVSEFSKKELVNYTGTKPEKIIVVPNGVEEEWFLPLTSEKVRERPYILYVGNVKPHKNLMSLIEGFKIIKDKIEEDLVIVGKKEGFITGDPLISKAAEELMDRIVFTGYVSDELLRKYYKNASVLVFPSLYEGFGLPPLEAMAVNCPTIVSNKASIPEVCKDATLYIEPEDTRDIAEKLLLVLNNKQIKNDLIEKGKVHVKKFSWNNTSGEIIEVFNEVLK